jgi:hypothetical protein
MGGVFGDPDTDFPAADVLVPLVGFSEFAHGNSSKINHGDTKAQLNKNLDF